MSHQDRPERSLENDKTTSAKPSAEKLASEAVADDEQAPRHAKVFHSFSGADDSKLLSIGHEQMHSCAVFSLDDPQSNIRHTAKGSTQLSSDLAHSTAIIGIEKIRSPMMREFIV